MGITRRLVFVATVAVLYCAPLLRAADAPATQPTLSATLPAGIKVELLGLFDAWDQAAASWLPDGTPTPARPPGLKEGSVRPHPHPGSFAAILGVRITFPEKAAIATTLAFEGCESSATSSSTARGVQTAVIGSSFPKTLQSTTLRIDIATGPWKKIIESDGKAAATAGNVSVGPLSIEEGQLAATFTFPTGDKSAAPADRRYIATDAEGKEHEAMGTTTSDDGHLITRTVTFSHLTADQVTKMRCDEREFDQWIEVRNVALLPGISTKPEVVTSETSVKK
jgi:hypothetical protein